MIGGLLVQMLHFADDIAIITDNQENLNNMLQKMNNTLKQDYYVNIKNIKTKILVGRK